MASGFMGAAPGLGVDQYRYHLGNMTLYLAVNDECVPISLTYVGQPPTGGNIPVVGNN